MAVVRRAQDDEGALGVGWSERGISGAARFHSSKGTDMGRGDGERAAGRGAVGVCAIQVFREGGAEFARLIRVAGTRVRGFTDGRFGEGAFRFRTAPLK